MVELMSFFYENFKLKLKVSEPPGIEKVIFLPEEMTELGIEDSDTPTTLNDEDDLREVDEIIMKASKELQRVAEENQDLLDLLEKNSETSIEVKQDYFDNNVMKKLEEAEQDAKDTANRIYELKTRVGELLKKEELTEDETQELDFKNYELKEQMKFFEKRTKDIQFLIDKSNFVYRISEGTANNIFSKKIPCGAEETNISKTIIGDGSRIGCCSCCSENFRKIPSVPTFAKKLSQSYTMQEKLAAENADLESVRFKLQEELLNKDQTLECLQRELSNLQNEMKVLTRENVTLNEKLNKMQDNEYQEVSKIHKNPFITTKKLQQYSDNTYELEKQLRDMENDVKCLHEEICAVQREREHLEKHRKMMLMPKTCQAKHVVSAFNVPSTYTAHSHPLKKGVPNQLIKELFNQYDKLENDLKFKINSVLSLKGDYEKLKKLTTEAEEYKKNSQEKVKVCENIMNKTKVENEASSEKEEQILAAKRRLKKAEDILKEEQQLINDQKKLVEVITSKFMEAQNQLEEQKHNLDVKYANEMSISPQLGSQIVSSLHDKLEEISI